MSDALKLTLLRLMKAHREQDGVDDAGRPTQIYREEDVRRVAGLFAYCLMGSKAFAESNSAPTGQEMEARLSATLLAPESLDAQILLLALHSGMADDAIAEQFDWE
ncbi:hypothetical protein ACTL6U_00885 [Rhodovibrionaceae bacterium A322]